MQVNVLPDGSTEEQKGIIKSSMKGKDKAVPKIKSGKSVGFADKQDPSQPIDTLDVLDLGVQRDNKDLPPLNRQTTDYTVSIIAKD